MNKALENQNYKTIWEAVIKNRHPEVKTLEEALNMEGNIKDCMIEHIMSPLSLKDRKSEVATILWDEGVDTAGNERWYCYKDGVTFTTIKRDISILGRPITLEDVLCILRDNFTYVSNGKMILELPACNEICKWQPSKPLHEQTPETWEAIAKVI